MKFGAILRNLIVFVVLIVVPLRSDYYSSDPAEKVRRYTRWEEFDYVTWTLDALGLKSAQGALDLQRYMTADQQHQVVSGYLDLLSRLDQVQSQIASIYADPSVSDPQQQAASLLKSQSELEGQVNKLAPLAESVIQKQVASVIGQMGLGVGGQPIPPTLYHITPLPLALIVSPRDVIRQDADISLLPDLSLDQITQLEDAVSQGLGVSALVVPVGGVGVYPTMVESTTDLTWLTQTVAHEWTHNFLTWHPLGALYDASPDLRTINETTANISGTEVGSQVIAEYYPELVPQPAPPQNNEAQATPATPQPPVFDFRAEMHTTRLTVDQLLADGKIDQAEAYMEARRVFFWDHGYHIRKLNQAYFAFYGAYADVPGGAAGVDPVGAAVRQLRADSPSLAAFLNKIAWVTSFADLQKVVAGK
jgi:hypothetical protein